MNKSLSTLHNYFDIIKLKDRLQIDDKLSESAIQEKAEMIRLCASKLIGCDIDPQTEAHGFYVPGRIEVLGKHTDYGGGRSVVAAAENGFCYVAVARDDDVLNITDVGSNETITFSLDPELTPQLGHWSNYPMTAVRRLAKNFPKLAKGADIVFQSDLPPASGMSSSSAMIVAFFLIMAECNDISGTEEYKLNIKNKEDLAGYLGTVENGQTFGTFVGYKGVGTFGGSEDHTAVLCCQAGLLSQYSYCPLQFE